MKKHVVVLTGAGISAESGLKTFRDSDGLWNGYNIEDVATPRAFMRNPQLVLDFYNMRRAEVAKALPNAAHEGLAALEKNYTVTIVTQNIDDLHERAGSSNVLHLHGEVRKSRSTSNPSDIQLINGSELNLGDKCASGSQLRPHIVWFGEPVPEMNHAIYLTKEAEIFIVIGTSLEVYPAASLLDFVQHGATKYLIDPNSQLNYPGIRVFHEKASIGVPQLIDKLLNLYV
jgi:NAD-dependent deacetylase